MTELDEQMKRCSHRPFMHNLMSGMFECLCGQTAKPINGWCPVKACLCGLPKTLIGSRDYAHTQEEVDVFCASTPLRPKHGFWHLWTELVYALEAELDADVYWYTRRLYRMAKVNGLLEGWEHEVS